MAQLMFNDIGANFREGQAFGTQQRMQREGEQRRNRLAELASQAYSAAPDQQQNLLGQMAAVSPEAAAQQSQQFGAEEDRRHKTLYNMARTLVGLPAQARAGVYQQMLPSLQQMGLSQLPPAYDEQTAPVIDQTAQALVQAWGGGENKRNLAVSPGSAIVDPETGRVIYERDFAPVKPQFQQDVNGQGWWLEPGKAPVPVNAPQASAPAVPRGPESGQAYTIDPSLPPAVQAAIRSNEQAWSQVQDGSGVQLPPQIAAATQGGPMFAPAGGVRDTFAPLTSDEIQQAGLPAGSVAQRNLRTNQVQVVSKPDAPTGFRFRQDGTLEPIPGGPKPAGAAATEGERKAATLLKRLEGSLSQMQTAVEQDPSASGPSVVAEIGRSLPFVGDATANVLNSPERQRVEAAQLDILDAALTLGTGAAYTREQLQSYRRAFFPQLGDDPSTIADKQTRLQTVISAARIAAGRAAPQAEAPNAPQVQTRAAGPQPGAVEDGFRFKGGNPADPNSWERI